MTHKWLTIGLKQPRIPEFYTLTKIHKKIPVGRPIVTGSSGPTERISSFVDSLLQPIAVKQESYLKDATDFINFIENTHIPDDVILATLDEGSPQRLRMTHCSESQMEATVQNLLSTWKIRILFKTGETAQVSAEMRRYNITVLGLCKTRWKQSPKHSRNSTVFREGLSVGTLAKNVERREKKTAPNIVKTRAAKAQRQAEYTEVNKAVKKSARKDKRNFIEGLAQEAEDAAVKEDMEDVYRIWEAKQLQPSGAQQG
ncbi:hypothetical protein ACROYT_G030073 [Oculina patagonica]